MSTEKYQVANAVCSWIDSINIWAGKISSYVVWLLVLMMSYEVVSRYLFNAPTVWSGELCQYGMCFASLLGGGYALIKDQHVRVDIVFRHFNFKTRAILELATWWVVVIFLLVLIWKGGELTIDAYLGDERSMTLLELPMFYSLSLVPLGSALLLIQVIARMVRNVLNLLMGHEEYNLVDSHF